VHPGRKTGSNSVRQEEAELGVTTKPYVVIVGGGQGGIALGARLRRLNVPGDHRREDAATRGQLA